MIYTLSHLFGMLLPWLTRFLFGRAVKTAGKKALKKAPVNLRPPNILLVGILVLGINGLNFLIHIIYSGKIAVPLISTTIITLVTAGFLLKGFFYPHSIKESVVLLSALLVIFALFVLSFVVFGITWLALVTKLFLEVLLGFAVMLAEVQKLAAAQTKAVDMLTERLGIRPDGFLGKFIAKYAVTADIGVQRDSMQSE